jgi:hypothetical protein
MAGTTRRFHVSARPRVLVAEDDAATRDLYRVVLVRESMRIIDTASGSAVVDFTIPTSLPRDGGFQDLAGEGLVCALKDEECLPNS